VVEVVAAPQQHAMAEQQGWRQRRSRRTTLLLAFAALAMERADAALLPAVYREIGTALQASPTALGSIALSRSVVQTACYPLAAYLAARHDRLTVIALGAFVWAAATFLIGFSTTFPQVHRARAPWLPACRQLPHRFHLARCQTEMSWEECRWR